MRVRLLLFASMAAVAVSSDAAKPMMKAIVAREYGGPEVLKLEEIPRPQPKDHEMLVRVIASGVNPADPLIVSGRFAKEFGTSLPLTPGYDVAGVVEATGEKVTKFKSGDRVYGYALMGGAWAEYAVLGEGEAAAIPKALSFVDAAAVPLGALTAWQALVDAAQVSGGQTVLVQGGSGGVGGFGVQLAKARGARVIATASTRNQDLLRQLGADLPIDYTAVKFEEVAKDVDVVLDTVGGDTLKRTYAVVKRGGIICTLRHRPDPSELEQRGIRGAPISVHPDAEDLTEISALIEAGKIKPIVSQVLPLADAVQAHKQIATLHTRGKIVLKVADE